MNIFTTVSDISIALKATTSDCLSLSMSEDEYQSYVSNLLSYKENRSLIFNGNDKFSSAFEKVMGKKRLALFKKTLIQIDSKRYGKLA